MISHPIGLFSKISNTPGGHSEMTLIQSGTVIKRTEGWKLLSGQSAVLQPKDSIH